MTWEAIIPALFGEVQYSIWPYSLSIIISLSPIIMAFALALIAWPLWVKYVRAKFFFSQKYILLEIRLPKDIYKSPKSMELFLLALHQTGGEGNWYSKYWLGMTRPWFSLEMVSVEGQVKFYIWARAGSKNFIESSLYAQFPGIEIGERDDYARTVHSEPSENGLWACELQLTKPDAYPIKTYVDYGLDKDPKEEFKVDPLAPLLEFLGSVGPNQQVWIQILVRAHKKEDRKSGHLWKATDNYKDEAQKIINEILIRDPKTKISGKEAKEGEFPKAPTITAGEKEIVDAIERNLTKQAFDIGIRCVYIAKNGFFSPANIGGILGSFKQFSTEHLNGFKPNGDYFHSKFDSVPWEDYRNIRRNRQSRLALMAYKRRSYFYAPFDRKPFVLSTEELATIFHFPGQVSATPTLERIPSKKSQAPTNLPI